MNNILTIDEYLNEGGWRQHLLPKSSKDYKNSLVIKYLRRDRYNFEWYYHLNNIFFTIKEDPDAGTSWFEKSWKASKFVGSTPIRTIYGGPKTFEIYNAEDNKIINKNQYVLKSGDNKTYVMKDNTDKNKPVVKIMIDGYSYDFSLKPLY